MQTEGERFHAHMRELERDWRAGHEPPPPIANRAERIFRLLARSGVGILALILALIWITARLALRHWDLLPSGW